LKTSHISPLIKTYNVDTQTPDSAGTMTAMMSSLKTDVVVIGVDENTERGEYATVSGNEVITVLKLAKIKGLLTGPQHELHMPHQLPLMQSLLTEIRKIPLIC
jgi:alkaline phosphatase